MRDAQNIAFAMNKYMNAWATRRMVFWRGKNNNNNNNNNNTRTRTQQ